LVGHAGFQGAGEVRTLEFWSRRLKPVAPRGRAALPRLLLVSDPLRLPDPLRAAARLPRGAGVLARGLSPAVLAALARLCRRRGLVLLVGGAGRTALAVRAGLHLPDRAPAAGMLPFLAAWRRRRGRLLLTAAVHGRRGAARARRLGVDAALVSPAFATASHPGAPSLGPLRWAALAARCGRPALALGGVEGATAGRLPRGGQGAARGLAAIGALAWSG
jgi:thiamine-phosphate pyrophosphorylase